MACVLTSPMVDILKFQMGSGPFSTGLGGVASLGSAAVTMDWGFYIETGMEMLIKESGSFWRNRGIMGRSLQALSNAIRGVPDHGRKMKKHMMPQADRVVSIGERSTNPSSTIDQIERVGSGAGVLDEGTKWRNSAYDTDYSKTPYDKMEDTVMSAYQRAMGDVGKIEDSDEQEKALQALNAQLEATGLMPIISAKQYFDKINS